MFILLIRNGVTVAGKLGKILFMRTNIFFCASLIVLTSCHKDEQNYDYISINPEIKSQAFKTGSYWIFQNDSTKKVDCTFIYYTRNGNYTEYHGLGYTSITEYYEMWYYNQNTITGFPSFKDRIESIEAERTITTNVYEPNWQVIYILKVPWKNYVQYFDSLQIGTHIFYKVEKVTTSDSTDYYTAKSIGVVKKVVRDTIDRGIWNLLRWKISK